MSRRRPPRLPEPTRHRSVLIHHRQADGRWVSVAVDEAAAVPFERSLMARRIPMHRGQRNTPGDYWSATDNHLLSYESWLEARWMTLLDFHPDVVAMSSQPFRLRVWTDEGVWGHVPDLFARLADGRGRVVDVKNPTRLSDPAVLRQAERTAQVCARIGLEYELVGEPDPVSWANVEWLSGYRRPIPFPAEVLDEVMAAAALPVPIGRLVRQCQEPMLARAALFHLCWFHRVGIDLTAPLRDTTLVWAMGEPER